MTRAATASMAAALAGDSVEICHLVELELDSGTSRFTDSYRPLTVNGEIYTALGHLLAFDRVEETAQLVVSETRITISVVDQVYLALFLNENYHNRKARVYLAVIDNTGAVISDPLLMIDGRLDQPVAIEDPDSETSTLSARIINQWSDFSRISGRNGTHDAQQLLFPGDRGFVHAHKRLNRIFWGRVP